MSKEIIKNNINKFEFSGAEIGDEIRRKIEDNFRKLIDELISQGAIPKGGSIHINLKNNEIESYFIKDKDGKIIEFADLKGGGTKDYKASIGDEFAKKGIILKDEELKKISQVIFRNELKDEIDGINEITATKN